MKKPTLKERVEELERIVAWLDWRLDKRLSESPQWYFLDVQPKPNPLKDWNPT